MVGEHIRVLKDGRWIHAIDCGDQTVLHLAEEPPPPRVRRAYRPEFVAGAVAVEVVTHRERTFPAKDIVKRAYSRASDPALASMFRDSEAFVEWCTTGRLSAPPNVTLAAPGAAAPAPAPASRRAARPAKVAVAVARSKARPAAATKGRKAKPARAKAPRRRAAPKAAKRRPATAKPSRRTARPGRRKAGGSRKTRR